MQMVFNLIKNGNGRIVRKIFIEWFYTNWSSNKNDVGLEGNLQWNVMQM